MISDMRGEMCRWSWTVAVVAVPVFVCGLTTTPAPGPVPDEAPARVAVASPSPTSVVLSAPRPVAAAATRDHAAQPVAELRVPEPPRITHPNADFLGSTIARHEQFALRPGVSATTTPPGTRGIDVSHWQGRINWRSVAARGIRFAYIKATEATSFTDPSFRRNYRRSAVAGLVRGAYHFAVPHASSGAAQANYLVNHGGGWSADGQTLPPALDIEYNPYGKNICYGLTRRATVAWVSGFARTVHRRTSRWPVIYTTANWWASCTGDSAVAGKRSPLWIASWNNRRRPTRLPHGWRTYTFWQYANHGDVPGDQDVFRGSYVELRSFATGGQRTPPKQPPVPIDIPDVPVPTAVVSILPGSTTVR